MSRLEIYTDPADGTSLYAKVVGPCAFSGKRKRGGCGSEEEGLDTPRGTEGPQKQRRLSPLSDQEPSPVAKEEVAQEDVALLLEFSDDFASTVGAKGLQFLAGGTRVASVRQSGRFRRPSLKYVLWRELR